MTNEYETLLNKAITGEAVDKYRFAHFCLRNSQYTVALEWFRSLADSGDADGQYYTAILYFDGKGCSVPYKEKAIELLHKAAASGHISAIARLEQLGYDVPHEDNSDQCDPPQPLTFRDLAFKQTDDGSYYCDIKNYDSYRSDPSTSHDPSYEHDKGLYANLELKIIEPDLKVDARAQLAAMIGLDHVKRQIELIENRLNFDYRRQHALLPTLPSCNHFIFYGSPGTGKTEVARTLGRIFRDCKLLQRGHVVEVDRSDLIAGWVGHTALKTKAVLDRARDGILLIDEAYTLFHDAGWDFGDEAVATIMKYMDDNRNDLVVIMAGYPAQMRNLVASNPGLKSRFRHHIAFPDYTPRDLHAIFDKFCNENNFALDPDARIPLDLLFKEACKLNIGTLGNGRFVRNVFELMIEKMAQRICRNNDTDLTTFFLGDIPSLSDVGGPISTSRIMLH